MRALVVHPDAMSRKLLPFVLTEGGYDDVVALDTLADSLRLIANVDVDLVLIGAELPDGEGAILCADLRARRFAGPILILSMQTDLMLKLRAFAAGVDDYVLEPVAPQELLARIQAISRRYGQADLQPLGSVLRVGDTELSVRDLRFRVAGRPAVHLTPTEMRILECLMRNAGIAVPRESLIERVWGFDFFGETNRVDVYVRRLRGKIEFDPARPEYLLTVRGVGYVFRAAEARTHGQVNPRPRREESNDADRSIDAAAGN